MRKRRRRLALGRMILAGSLLVLATFAIAACNTVKGMGEDITALGQGGQDIIDGGM